MFVAETAIAMTLLCSSAKKRQDGSVWISSEKAGSCFVASGRTLESKMSADIENLPGVVGVAVKRTGNTFDVSVVMESMEFEPFDRVVGYKLELYDRYPACVFNFKYELASIAPVAAKYAA